MSPVPDALSRCPHRAHDLRIAWALVALVAAGAPRAVWGDSQPFCVLQSVDVNPLSNATRIMLKADGIIRLDSGGLDQWTQDARGNWYPTPQERITFTLRNVRAGAAPMVQVAHYPISHLEFALPPGETDNVGLRCTIVLYKPALVLMFNGEDDSWDYGTWRPGPGPYVMITPTQKKDQIQITVLSDRSEEPEPKRPDPPAAKPRLDVSGTTEGLNVNAVHADFHDVIKQIGRLTGASLCVDDPVSSQVTAHFEGLALKPLLGALATAYGLCLSDIDGVLHFSLSRPDTATSYWVGETRALTLNYVPVQQALLLLPDVALPYVRRVDSGNMLVASGPPAMVARIARDVAALDRPGYQCRLQGWVLATERNDSRLQDVLAGFTDGSSRGSFDSSGNLTVDTGTHRGQSVTAQLRALATTGRLKVQRLPSVWCKSGETASLFVGQTIYYWRYPRRGTDQYLERTQAGTQLTFQPRTDGECITASVAVGSDWAGLGGQAPRYGPLVMRRSATSTVQLRSGGLMVVGGLRQTSDAREHRHPGAWLWPVDAIATGHLRLRQDGELAVLVQMDAAQTPPVAGEMPEGTPDTIAKPPA